MCRSFTLRQAQSKRSAFTLIELLVVLGILGILAGIVITAVAPSRQLAAANDAWRKSASREISNAITQYVIESGGLPSGIPTGSSNALPICAEGMAGETGCVDLDILVTDNFLTALPVDTAESSGALIGFTIYEAPGGFVTIDAEHLGAVGQAGGDTGGTTGGSSGGGMGCVDEATYPIDPSGWPGRMAIVNSKLYAVLSLGPVAVIDTETDTVSSTVTVGNDASDIFLYGTKMYVTNQGDGTVSVIDTDTDTVSSTITVGSSPFYGAVVNNKIYTANAYDDTVSVINPATDAVIATISVGSYPYMIVGNGTKAYVTNQNDDTVSVIDTATDTVSSTIGVGDEPSSIASLGSYVYVINNTDVTASVINTATDTVSATISVGTTPGYIMAGSSSVYVANYGDSTVSVITGTSLASTPSVTFPYATGDDAIVPGSGNNTAVTTGKAYFSGGTQINAMETTGYTMCN